MNFMNYSSVLMVLLFVMVGCRSQSNLVMEMDHSGHLRWNGQSVANHTELRSKIRHSFKKYENRVHPVIFRLGSDLTVEDIRRTHDVFREEGFYNFQYETETWKTEPQLDLLLEPMYLLHSSEELTLFPLFGKEELVFLKNGLFMVQGSLRPPLQEKDSRNKLVILCGAGESVELLVWGIRVVQATGYSQIMVLIIGKDEPWPDILQEQPNSHGE
ncbi:MAG: hypothetical protein JJU05_13875 [Verrucomicrobia bacterium]|nr:hypothetical protein [Verrucomicrobiota bacterium]